MNKLEDRFDTEIENRKFSFFEMKGFMTQPKLAIKAGMAIGYYMAMNDIAAHSANSYEDIENARKIRRQNRGYAKVY